MQLVTPGPSRYAVCHVLAVESIRYSEVLASAVDTILLDCVCARCGSNQLTLTGSWVQRAVHTASAYGRIAVRLACCRICRSRERILPCNLLPGKVNDVTNVVDAVMEADRGTAITAVARAHDVSPACLRQWIRGLPPRVLDLAPLFRHRAILVRDSPPEPSVLVRFWAFVTRSDPDVHPSALSPLLSFGSRTEKEESACQVLVLLVERAGSVLAIARLGAELFSQAVLLFRGGAGRRQSRRWSGRRRPATCPGVLGSGCGPHRQGRPGPERG